MKISLAATRDDTGIILMMEEYNVICAQDFVSFRWGSVGFVSFEQLVRKGWY